MNGRNLTIALMALPLLLSTWVGGPVLIKFGIVALVTILLSFGISKYIVKPYPRFVVIGLVGLNAMLVLVI